MVPLLSLGMLRGRGDEWLTGKWAIGRPNKPYAEQDMTAC